MYENGIITTTLPESLRASLAGIPEKVELLGKGSNAVVVRDPQSGDVVKFYGHNRLTDDPYIYNRIQQHYGSEVLAMSHLDGLNGLSPRMIDHNRIHPSAEANTDWELKQIYGWIKMSYIEGLRQDVIAIQHLGAGFKAEERNEPFYYSVGHMLGRFHQATRSIDIGKVEHDVHENDLNRLHMFADLQRAKLEAVSSADVRAARQQVIDQSVSEIERVYQDIVDQKGSYSFIHADFATRNMLYQRENGQVRASAIIDFGAAGIGLPEHDFVPMKLGDQPAAIDGYRDAGGDFSPQRYALVNRADQLTIQFTRPR